MKPRERRIERRACVPGVHFVLQGERHAVCNISFGGLSFVPCASGHFALEDILSGELAVATAFGERTFGLSGRVVRVEPGTVGIHFDRPDHALMARIRHLFIH